MVASCRQGVAWRAHSGVVTVFNNRSTFVSVGCEFHVLFITIDYIIDDLIIPIDCGIDSVMITIESEIDDLMITIDSNTLFYIHRCYGNADRSITSVL